MQLNDAIELIRGGIANNDKKVVWAELGAGEGLFTRALATLLKPGSSIQAVDIQRHGISSPVNDVKVEYHQLDFTNNLNLLSDLDGVLMANALHFVSDKFEFLSRLKKILNQNGRLIIVEYELEAGNKWVPYPVTFGSLKDQLSACGYSGVQRLAERKSIYGSHKIYAAVACVR
jgi:2-polyprenyl-3-methyl-5-hydroxy-6-metoxy-1,4-benzoquinol methylase